MKALAMLIIAVCIFYGTTIVLGDGETSKILTYSEVSDLGSRIMTFYVDNEKVGERKREWSGDGLNETSIERISGNIPDGIYFSREDNKSFVTLKDGKQDGKNIRYYPTGELKDERLFQGSQQIDVSKRYYKSGKLRATAEFFGDSYFLHVFDENGMLREWYYYTVTYKKNFSEIVRTDEVKELRIFDKQGNIISQEKYQ